MLDPSAATPHGTRFMRYEYSVMAVKYSATEQDRPGIIVRLGSMDAEQATITCERLNEYNFHVPGSFEADALIRRLSEGAKDRPTIEAHEIKMFAENRS